MTISQEYNEECRTSPENSIKRNKLVRCADSDTEVSMKKADDFETNKEILSAKTLNDSKNDYYMVVHHMQDINNKKFFFL